MSFILAALANELCHTLTDAAAASNQLEVTFLDEIHLNGREGDCDLF